MELVVILIGLLFAGYVILKLIQGVIWGVTGVLRFIFSSKIFWLIIINTTVVFLFGEKVFVQLMPLNLIVIFIFFIANLFKRTKSVNETSTVSSSSIPKVKNPKDGPVGTGFFINNRGFLITNSHVVGDRTHVQLTTTQREEYQAKLIANDVTNDLAILHADISGNSYFCLSDKDALRMSSVTALGYGYAKWFSSHAKATRGIISSVSGMNDNFSIFQFDASIQPGNSGGPVIDEEGRVVGVAVASLDYAAAFRITETIPQNINFAIKVSTLSQFLNSNKVEYSTYRNRKDNREFDKLIDDAVIYVS